MLVNMGSSTKTAQGGRTQTHGTKKGKDQRRKGDANKGGGKKSGSLSSPAFWVCCGGEQHDTVRVVDSSDLEALVNLSVT